MGPARSVCGHPEAVQLHWTDPGPGAAEAPQPALPHTRPNQRACFSVTNSFGPILYLLLYTLLLQTVWLDTSKIINLDLWKIV